MKFKKQNKGGEMKKWIIQILARILKPVFNELTKESAKENVKKLQELSRCFGNDLSKIIGG